MGGAEGAHGSGLEGLHDRVAAMDGDLDIASPAGVGTRIVASIPAYAAVKGEMTEVEAIGLGATTAAGARMRPRPVRWPAASS